VYIASCGSSIDTEAITRSRGPEYRGRDVTPSMLAVRTDVVLGRHCSEGTRVNEQRVCTAGEPRGRGRAHLHRARSAVCFDQHGCAARMVGDNCCVAGECLVLLLLHDAV
jgi:hypothetical protein